MFRREHYVVTSPLLDFLLEVLAEIHGKKLALFIREEVHLTPPVFSFCSSEWLIGVVVLIFLLNCFEEK